MDEQNKKKAQRKSRPKCRLPRSKRVGSSQLPENALKKNAELSFSPLYAALCAGAEKPPRRWLSPARQFPAIRYHVTMASFSEYRQSRRQVLPLSREGRNAGTRETGEDFGEGTFER